MRALRELEEAGYEFSLTDSGTVGYVYRGLEPPDAAWEPLLQAVRANRPEVAALLAARRSPAKASAPLTTRTRLPVIFPADTPLPFPAGRWRRLGDGRIEAWLCYDDLRIMRHWRDEIL